MTRQRILEMFSPACGGGPVQSMISFLLLPVSPGVRGWTDYFRRHHWKPRVFPRRAGVDPDRGK